ncbi:MAG TPA: glycosyl hydrolase, partial [Chryseosolibacter sp.]|nr:glycosyl hydrolase [Chryseosolibacter sp.]
MLDDILVFAYFKGHGDGLHLAVSEDGYRWSALNNDHVLLEPAVGIERIMRDPCLFPGRDGNFHLVWTIGWREKGIGYC